MQEEAVTFTNDRGERLAGTLLWPAQQQGADAAAAAGSTHGGGVPCVLLAHGYMSGRSSELLVRLATALGREGIASLRWDFSGNGDSEGRFKYGCYRCGGGLHACSAAFCCFSVLTEDAEAGWLYGKCASDSYLQLRHQQEPCS